MAMIMTIDVSVPDTITQDLVEARTTLARAMNAQKEKDTTSNRLAVTEALQTINNLLDLYRTLMA